VWNLTAPAPVVSTPALYGGLAVAGCDNGLLYALEIVEDGIDDGIQDPENSTTDLVWTANLTALVAGTTSRYAPRPRWTPAWCSSWPAPTLLRR